MRLALPAFLLLSACMPEHTSGPAGPDETACGAGALQHFVGEPVAGRDFDSAEGPVRIIPPGTAVTMDYRADRLNVETDEDGVITRIYCG